MQHRHSLTLMKNMSAVAFWQETKYMMIVCNDLTETLSDLILKYLARVNPIVITLCTQVLTTLSAYES